MFFPAICPGFPFFFLSVSHCSHFVVQVNLQGHSLCPGIIFCILSRSAFVFSLLCLHLFLLSIFSFLPSFLVSLLSLLSVQLLLFCVCSSFQPFAFISTLGFRLFPSGSGQRRWVTIVFSCRPSGAEEPR